MARLPGVRYLSSPGSMPRMDGAGQAVGRATEQLGAAIGQQADTLFKYAGKLRQAKDAAGMSAFLTEMDAKATDFENGLITSQDPAGWVDRWNSDTQSWGQGIDGVDISPEAKAQLRIQFNEWKGAKTDRLSTTAALKTVETTKGIIENNLNYYRKRNDRIGYNRTRNEAEGTGLYPPDRIQQIDMIGEESFFENDQTEKISADPKKALEEFKDPDFVEKNPWATEDMQNKLTLQAEQAVSERRKAQMDLLDDRFESGARALKQSEPPTSETQAGVWRSLYSLRDLRDNPGVTNEQYLEAYNEARADALGRIAPNFQGDIKKELNYLSPAGRDPQDPTIDRAAGVDELATMSRRNIDMARDQNTFGNVDEDADPKVKAQAYRKAELLGIQMKRFIKNNPKATEFEVLDETDRLISEGVEQRGAERMQSMIPGSGGAARKAASSVIIPRSGPVPELPRGGPMDFSPGVLPPLNEDPDDYINRLRNFTD
jgi:hypothetical protein